jgi:hypothetical protein
MAASEELVGFVREALGRGLSRTEIEDVLSKAGWRPEQVREALAAFAEVAFPLPVPRPRAYLSARETFLYLALFTALYMSAWHVGNLVFQFINRAYPDPAAGVVFAAHIRESIRWSIATLIITFPVYLYVSFILSRAFRRDPTKRASNVRKWLTYLTLFVAGGVLSGDLITLFYNFLGGELTMRFLLKVLTVAILAGVILIYYLRDIRKEEEPEVKRGAVGA